jgi:hypothetical protein
MHRNDLPAFISRPPDSATNQRSETGSAPRIWVISPYRFPRGAPILFLGDGVLEARQRAADCGVRLYLNPTAGGWMIQSHPDYRYGEPLAVDPPGAKGTVLVEPAGAFDGDRMMPVE